MKTTTIIFSLVTLLGAQACSGADDDTTPAPQDTGCGMFCPDDTGAPLDTSDDVTADTGGDAASDASAYTGSNAETGSSAERAAIAGEVRGTLHGPAPPPLQACGKLRWPRRNPCCV